MYDVKDNNMVVNFQKLLSKIKNSLNHLCWFKLFSFYFSESLSPSLIPFAIVPAAFPIVGAIFSIPS